MIDALNLILEELVKKDLKVQEIKSLTAEISKKSVLLDGLCEKTVVDLNNIELSSGMSQPLHMI